MLATLVRAQKLLVEKPKKATAGAKTPPAVDAARLPRFTPMTEAEWQAAHPPPPAEADR